MTMSPPEYIQAREAGVERAKIDGQYYMPSLKVDCDDDSSIRRAVMELLELNNDNNEMTVTKVSGGITNQLFKVTYNNNNAILVRVFGAEGMIDRDVENSTYAALSAAGLAPKYHGRFANGRLEEWLEARPLSIRELPDYSTPIAQQLGRFHSSFQIPDYLLPYHPPNRPSLWSQLDTWMQQALSSKFQTTHDTERAAQLHLESIPNEIHYLHSSVIPHDSPVSFCHNDVLSANILLLKDQGTTIQLIDFEYGGVNFRAFDIANHWNEYAGGTEGDGVPRYEWFPTQQMQRTFIEAYLQAYDDNESPTTNEEVEEFHAQVHAFVLVNHLYWGLWAVNQAAMEGCKDFDYLLYATNRINQYYKCKKEHQAEKMVVNNGVK